MNSINDQIFFTTLFEDIILIITIIGVVSIGIYFYRINSKYWLNKFLAFSSFSIAFAILFLIISFGIVKDDGTGVLYNPFNKFSIFSLIFFIFGPFLLLMARNVLFFSEQEALKFKRYGLYLLIAIIVILFNLFLYIFMGIYPFGASWTNSNSFYFYFGALPFNAYVILFSILVIFGFYKVMKKSQGAIKSKTKFLIAGTICAYILPGPVLVFDFFPKWLGYITIMFGYLIIGIGFKLKKN